MTKHRTQRRMQGRTSGRSRPSLHSTRTSSSPTVSQFLLLLLLRMLQKCPLTFWGILAATPVITAVLALSMLLSPGYVSEQSSAPSPSPAPVVPDLPTPIPPPLPLPAQAASRPVSLRPNLQLRDGAQSLLSLSVIVLTCAGGTLLVSRYLTQPKPVRRLIKAPDRTASPGRLAASPTVSAAPAPAPSRRSANLPAPIQPQSSNRRPAAIQPIAIQSPLPRSKAAPPRSAAQPTPQPTAVTVLPPDQNHALDWDEGSLVNSMDIRKRRSVSSWM